jgi:hypothetical protein
MSTSMRLLVRYASLLAALCVGALATGCATVTGEPTQSVSIMVVDEHDRSVEGLSCHVYNGSAEYFGNSPMHGLDVRRSANDLQIECKRGSLVARGTAVSRGGVLLSAMLPGGTAMVALDHLTGYCYSYPNMITLRLGQHLVFDAGDQIIGRPTRGMQAERPQ